MENYGFIAISIAALVLLTPLILGNMHRLYVPFTLVALLLFCLNSIAPYSPEARSVLLMVHYVPETVIDAVFNGQDGLTEINSGYFHAFH